MKKTSKKKFTRAKKNLHSFIKDEDGYVSKENILKIGLGTISALGVLGGMSNAYAAHSNHPSHSNSLTSGVVHASVSSHASHDSY
jgi:hypothetical protein